MHRYLDPTISSINNIYIKTVIRMKPIRPKSYEEDMSTPVINEFKDLQIWEQTVIEKQPKLLRNKRLLETSFSVQNECFDTNYSYSDSSILHISSEEKSCDNRTPESCCSRLINSIFNSCKCNDEFQTQNCSQFCEQCCDQIILFICFCFRLCH
jgi:hypothetical protein